MQPENYSIIVKEHIYNFQEGFSGSIWSDQIGPSPCFWDALVNIGDMKINRRGHFDLDLLTLKSIYEGTISKGLKHTGVVAALYTLQLESYIF